MRRRKAGRRVRSRRRSHPVSRCGLELRGAMSMPIRDVREVKFNLWVDADYRIGPSRPAYVGYITQIRPEAAVIASCRPGDFEYVWSLALSGNLTHAYMHSLSPITTQRRFYQCPSPPSRRNSSCDPMPAIRRRRVDPFRWPRLTCRFLRPIVSPMAASLTLSADLTRRHLGNSSITEESPPFSNLFTFREKPEVPVAPPAIKRSRHSAVSVVRVWTGSCDVTDIEFRNQLPPASVNLI